jgi:hypothetical protein
VDNLLPVLLRSGFEISQGAGESVGARLQRPAAKVGDGQIGPLSAMLQRTTVTGLHSSTAKKTKAPGLPSIPEDFLVGLVLQFSFLDGLPRGRGNDRLLA